MNWKNTKLKRLFTLSSTTLILVGSAAAQSVIVQEDFNGTGDPLDGSTAELFDNAVTTAGGSNIWVSSDTYSDDGSVNVGSGTNSSAHLSLGSYINDTKGTSTGIFDLTMTIGAVTGIGNIWLSVGFSELSAPATNNHFINLDATGTIILRGSGELDTWGGPGSNNAIDGPDGNAGARTVTVTLDLSTHDGVDDFGSVTWSDSLLGEINSHDYTEDVDFSSIFLSEANGTLSTISNLTLTQVADPNAPNFAITEINYAPEANTVTLTWTSSPDDSYIAQISNDLTQFDADIGDGITMAIDDEDETDGNHLTKTFDLSLFSLENAEKLFFRIMED